MLENPQSIHYQRINNAWKFAFPLEIVSFVDKCHKKGTGRLPGPPLGEGLGGFEQLVGDRTELAVGEPADMKTGLIDG